MSEDSFHYHLIVIGSGPAGQRAALQGAKAGKRVAIIESSDRVGGHCTFVGTLPSKSLRESVYRWSLGSRGALGQQLEPWQKPKASELPEMKRLMRRMDRVTATESQVIYDQLKRNGVEIFTGRARVHSPYAVEVHYGDYCEKVTCDFIFIATGSGPISPAEIPVDGKFIFDSNTIYNMKKTPKSLIVLGAGIIGCEFASMFAMMGTKVTLIDNRHEILASVDREIVSHLVDRFDFHGMELLLEVEAEKVQTKTVTNKEGKKRNRVEVKLTNGRTIRSEAILVAMGRRGNTDDLGLDSVGVTTTERGLIPVDENFRTKCPSVYAVGDVIGYPALASTSMEQGRVACCHAFGVTGETACGFREFFPYGIYTIPEISSLGPTEEELIKNRIPYVAGKARYKELARGQIVGDRWGLLKLLVDRESLKILGVHIIGDNAAELIHIGQAVMNFNGTVQYFIESVFNYPTLAEAYKTAAFHAVNLINMRTSHA